MRFGVVEPEGERPEVGPGPCPVGLWEDHIELGFREWSIQGVHGPHYAERGWRAPYR